MEHVPQPSPSTLVILMPLTVTGELSTWYPSPMPCCNAATNANTLNDEPVGNAGLVLRARLLRRHRRRELLRGTVLLGQRADVDHAVEHPVPPLRGTVRVDGGIQTRRPLDERGQQRTLCDIELLDRLVEV